MQIDSYTIHLEHFEGPFDLLLFFIQRDELDIYDIPIAKITDDFLAFLRQMEELNIELASEFILVAASLMRIKAKMLLPRKAVNEAGEEIDPREELVARLMEYKRFKDVIVELREMEERRGKIFARGNSIDEMQIQANQALVDIELESLTLFNLFKAFQKVLNRQKENKKAIHTIVRYNYTIRGQQRQIFDRLMQYDRPSFEELFEDLENRIHAIVHFLALLELANMQILRVVQGDDINQFWIERGVDFEKKDEVLSHRDEEE
jgi:segregation and condensation protein A